MKLLFFFLVFTAISLAQFHIVIVKPGGNIIGALITGLPDQIMNTIPTGILASPYYGFEPGLVIFELNDFI